MPWSTLASNQTVSFTNLLDAVNTGVFQQKATITASDEQITKADANTYVNINTSFGPYAAKASNQLVVKSNLQSGISAPYEWTFWYDGCCTGCVDPEVRLQGKDGYIRAGDLKIGDEVESDLGYGVVSYIEYKQQPKFLIRTANRVAPVSDTHQFIDGEGNIILASDLIVGSLVNTDEGVEEITFIGEKHVGEVIDITVEGTHHYYANGFLSHNKACFTYAGWATSGEACINWGTVSWSLWSVDNPIVAGSKLYGSSTGGAAPRMCSGYPYLFSNYLNQWIEVSQFAPEYDFDVVAIGTCTANVTFYGVMGDLSSSFGTLYYSTDNSTWNPIAASFSYTCGVIDVITVSSGATVYVSIGDPSSTAYYYNAQVGTSCPFNSATYCGSGSKFSTVVSGNTDIAITQYVTGGDILAC
jgi:hypothetical protein